MKSHNCNLLADEDIEDRLEKLDSKKRKAFLKAIEIITYVEIGRSILHEPLLEEEVEIIREICEEKEDYEIMNHVKNVTDQRDLMKVNTKVIFAGSSYTIVKRDDRKIDIKQNFSIGLVYERVDISQVKLG